MNRKLENIVFYEIYPNSFCDSNGDGYGDFQGIISKLDYIKSLGVGGIWLNPHYDSPFMDGGYDVRDFYSCSSRYGTEEDFDDLIEEIHSRGMVLIVDLVAGHSSEDCKWFLESAKAERNEYSDLYIWTDSAFNCPNNYKLQAGRYQRDGAFFINFFVTQPAFNYGFNNIEYPEWQMSYKDPRTFKARDLMVDICKYWLRRGVDGFRVDMAFSLVKNDPEPKKPATCEVWQYIFERVREDYPKAIFVSEWGNPEASLRAGFDMDFILDFNSEFYHKILRHEKSYFKCPGEYNIQDLLNQVIAKIDDTHCDGYFSFISGNHDVTRCSYNLTEEQTKLYMFWVLTMPGIPFVYYGDEIYMKYQDNLKSKECGYGRTGSRTPMPWNDTKSRGFSEADEDQLFLPSDFTTSVEEQEDQPRSLLHMVRNLIHFRNAYRGLQGNRIIQLKLRDDILAYKRNDLTVIINASKEPFTFDKTEVLFSTGDVKVSKGELTIGAESAVIVK